MENKYEELGQIIDSLDSLTYSMQLPLGDKMHVEMLKEILPPKNKKETEQVLTIEISGHPYSFTQNKGETLSDFKVRVQKEFDIRGVNIQIV